VVAGSRRHAGTEHFVIRQPDQTLALVPAWMTEPGLPAAHQLLPYPRLAVERLVDLRALVDALMASCQGNSPRYKGVGHEERATPPEGSVRAGAKGRGPSARPAAKLTPLLQALLTEAAGVEPDPTTADDLGREEDGDDQDHA
jgi:hypothetical protein